jgi:hypothetical protein
VVLYEIDEHVEHLGTQRDALPRPAQFIELRVEGILAKAVEYRPHPPLWPCGPWPSLPDVSLHPGAADSQAIP